MAGTDVLGLQALQLLLSAKFVGLDCCLLVCGATRCDRMGEWLHGRRRAKQWAEC